MPMMKVKDKVVKDKVVIEVEEMEEREEELAVVVEIDWPRRETEDKLLRRP